MQQQRSTAERKGLVVFCQHGIGDTLIAPLMLDYIIRLQQQVDRFDVLFITEEPPGAAVPDGIVEHLRTHRMEWLPLRYDLKGRQWAQRLRNLWRMLWATRAFMRAKGKGWLLGYLSYGGSYAIICSLLGMGPCAVVNFEPHSRYMSDTGHWGRGALRTRVVAWLERAQMRYCKAMVIPTTPGRDMALVYRPSGITIYQGITIDVEKSRFDPAARSAIRARHGWTDEVVLVYVGKFGGIYHSVDEIMRFIEQVVTTDRGMRFLIISQQVELDRIRAHEAYDRIARCIALQPPVPAEELRDHLSATDLGIVAIPNTPAQVYRSPLKTAHYWAAGVALVTPAVIIDDARIARDEGVGIVVNDFPVDDPRAFCANVRSLCAGDRHALRERCIVAAFKHRDTTTMVNELKRILI